MVFNASILDWLALVLFFVAVVAYSRYADHVGDRLLNARMREVRAIWMRRYLERIPVIAVDGEAVAELFVDEEALRRNL